MKKINVLLKDIDKVCRECGKVSETTKLRCFKTKAYKGPCGDSFCYGSCDSEICRSVEKAICDTCYDYLKK